MTSTITNTHLSSRDRVEEYLTKAIVNTNVGQSLPTVRQVMKDCQVSQSTVQSVLDLLRRQGVVQAEPRRRIVKLSRTQQQDTESTSTATLVNQLDLVYCGFSQHRHPGEGASNSFHHDLLSQFGRLSGAMGKSVRVHEVSADAKLEDFHRVVQEIDSGQCVIVSNPIAEVDDVMRENGIQFVNLFPRTAEVPANSIVIDPAEVVNKQLDHLVKLGHRKIAYLHGIDPNRFHRDLTLRREQFYKYIAEHSLPLEPHWVQFGGYDSNTTINAVKQIMQGDNKPTAAIVSDPRLPLVYYVLREQGFTAGKNFSIVGTDDLPLASDIYPAATSLRVPRRRAAYMALRLLAGMQDNQTQTWPAVLPVNLVVRASTSACLETEPEVSVGN